MNTIGHLFGATLDVHMSNAEIVRLLESTAILCMVVVKGVRPRPPQPQPKCCFRFLS